MAECLRTAVRFRPSPPNNQTTLAVVFLFSEMESMSQEGMGASSMICEFGWITFPSCKFFLQPT